MKLQLTDIQRFSTKDGPGIRTTLFAKGCSIRCPWCANPECLDNGHFGEYEISDVYELCMRDRDYYEKNGGITASGGEALLQSEAFAELFGMVKNSGVGRCIETSLYAEKDKLEALLPVNDYWFVDFKILDATKAREVIKADYDFFCNNLELLFSRAEREKICVRVPLVRDMTLTDDNLAMVVKLLQEYRPGKCELFSVHNLAKAKYERLGLEFKPFEVVSVDELKCIAERLSESGCSIDINII